MKFSPSLLHYAMYACTAVAAGALAWAQSDPGHAEVAHAVAALAGTLGTFFGSLSGAALQKKGS